MIKADARCTYGYRNAVNQHPRTRLTTTRRGHGYLKHAYCQAVRAGSIRAQRASERSEGYGWQRARLERRPGGEPPRTNLREVINALLYVNCMGISWRYIPHDLPPKGTVYYYYGLWRDEGILAQLNVHLTELARTKEGREPQPSAALVDTQRVKTSTNTPLETQGTDAAKKIVRRRRAIVTDACGFLLALVVLAASVSENSAGMRAIGRPRPSTPR